MRISIYTLIFDSIEFADWIYTSLYNNTPELVKGEATFCFIANNASPKVIAHLKEKNYNYVEHNIKYKTEKELNNEGISEPYYLHTVYSAYNFAVSITFTPYIAILNSDMYPCMDWLSSPLKRLEKDNIVITSKLVEPKRGNNIFRNRKNGKQVVEKNLGFTLLTFKKKEFLLFADTIRTKNTEEYISYQPIFARTETLKTTPYPVGNILSDYWENSIPSAIHRGNSIEYGDEVIVRKLKEQGIPVIQDNYSIAYHLDCGERLRKI